MRTSLAVVCALGVSTSAAASSIDREAIRRPIRRENPSFTRCYEKQLKANPKLGEGSVLVEFMIGQDGRVIDATATGFDDAVAACVAKVFLRIRFPRSPSGTIRVNYPFVFRH